MADLIILCHNVFWFQGSAFETDQPPPPDPGVLEHLCGVYRRMVPDVVCLQEIQDPATFNTVAERLTLHGSYCAGRVLSPYGGGVLWRGKGALVADASGVSAAPPQRMWQTLEVDVGGQTIRICNVHLPSGRQLGRAKSAEQRISELENLFHGRTPGSMSSPAISTSGRMAR